MGLLCWCCRGARSPRPPWPCPAAWSPPGHYGLAPPPNLPPIRRLHPTGTPCSSPSLVINLCRRIVLWCTVSVRYNGKRNQCRENVSLLQLRCGQVHQPPTALGCSKIHSTFTYYSMKMIEFIGRKHVRLLHVFRQKSCLVCGLSSTFCDKSFLLYQ